VRHPLEDCYLLYHQSLTKPVGRWLGLPQPHPAPVARSRSLGEKRHGE